MTRHAPGETNDTQAPVRSCLGCGSRHPKRELIRLVLSLEGQLQVDPAQKAPGRGAYLCGAGCLKAAAKRKAFQRAFRGAMKGLELASLEASLGLLQSRLLEGQSRHVEKARS